MAGERTDEPPRPALARGVLFEATRQALRHRLAMRSAHFAAQRGDASDTAREELLHLGRQLRSLHELDDEGLALLRERCAASLRAEGLPGQAGELGGTLPPEEHERIFQELIVPVVLGGCEPVPCPQAVVIGSHLGSGTAHAMGAACASLGGPLAAAIITLEDLRAFHPGHAALLRRDARLAAHFTQADALGWLDRTLHLARKRRLTLVLEAAMRSTDGVLQAFRQLRASDYWVEARALAVPHAASWEAIQSVQELNRLETGVAASITSAAHQATFDGLAEMLDRIERDHLADRVTVYDAQGNCRYWHETAGGTRSAPVPAVNVLRVVRALPPSLQDLKQSHDTYSWLERLLTAPGRSASNEELLRIEGLRWDAECALLAHAFLTVPEGECLKAYPQLAPAFDILANLRAGAEGIPGDEGRLMVKKAAEGIARRISHGNLAMPIPW